MKSVGAFFSPLWKFIVGMGLLLVIILIGLGPITDATNQMAANVTAAQPDVATKIWGWSMISTGEWVMLVVVLIALCFILWAVAKAWLKSRYAG